MLSIKIIRRLCNVSVVKNVKNMTHTSYHIVQPYLIFPPLTMMQHLEILRAHFVGPIPE